MSEIKILSDFELKINLKRKLEKVDSQILRQVSSKKKLKKIKCQHYNEYYINDDCLAEIFMYIPICERPKMALVCKQWSRALYYSWFRVKQVELSHWKYHNQDIFERFREATRFSLYFSKSLLNNCGYYLAELDLVGYDNSDIVYFVNEFCPNLVKLRLRFSFIKNEELENVFSRMSKLKILKMIFQCTCGIPETVLNSLKDVSNTLNELTLAYWSEFVISDYVLPRSFTAIISQLKSLKKIEITGIKFHTDLYESIKSAGLNQLIDNYLDDMCINMSNKYMFLRDLCLINYEVTDDVLYTFANNIQFLRLIKVLSTYITNVGIQTISKMKHLRYLHLYGANLDITDSSIKLLKNLLVLRLPYTNKITNSSVKEVLKNSPLMNWLTIVYTGVTPRFAKKAAKIASKRGEYLILCVSFDRVNFFRRAYRLPYLAIHHHDESVKINRNIYGCSSETICLKYYE